MRRLRIAIDPLLKKNYGPEVSWAWRLLLSSMGFPWEEAPAHAPACDIAYVSPQNTHVGRNLVCVRADLPFWRKMSSIRLASVKESAGWQFPVFQGERPSSHPFHASAGRLVCERDIICDLFWLVTGQEEQHWPRNRFGFFDLGETVFCREQTLRLALASGIAASLEKALTGLRVPPPFPRWPHGKKAAACASHDVDYPKIVRWLEPVRVIYRNGLGGVRTALSLFARQRQDGHLGHCVSMEKEVGTRSAFYFAATRGSPLRYAAGTPDPFYDVRSEPFRKLFRYLNDEGFEIGLHASYNAFESPTKFAAEKRTLEKVSGREIKGNRHHCWHLNPDDPESTLLLHERIGLKYDTSLAHERYVGWRRGLSWPFLPFHQKERRELKTLQLPTAWMDIHLFRYRQDNPGQPADILRAIADKTMEQGGCLLVDVHDYSFDEDLFPGQATAYRTLWKHVTADSDFWVQTPGRIAEHWIKRYTSIVQASKGLAEGSASS